MRQVAEFGSPPPLFVITGGDPFQRPDLTTLVRHGTDLGLAVSVSPSGTPTLTRAALAAVRSAGARVISLSIDAADPISHDRFRGVDGVYESTRRAWRDATALGLKVQINTTVSRDNVRDLPRIAATVHEQGAQLWSVLGRPHRVRRPPMRVSGGDGFVFVSHRGEVRPVGSCRSPPATFAGARWWTSTAPHRC